VHGGKYKKFLRNFSSVIDGKQISRFPQKRFTQICDGNARMGMGLRGAFLDEVEKVNNMKKKKLANNRVKR